MKTPEELCKERAQRIQDAYDLKQPDRIPITLNFGYMLARLENVTFEEMQNNPKMAQEALERWAQYYQPDQVSGMRGSPTTNLILGDRQTRWPGHGLPPDQPFQFVEGEYMKAEDYDAFLDDPADFAIRKYIPRVFSELEGFSMFPHLGTLMLGYGAVGNIAVLNIPAVASAFEAMAKAAKAVADARPEQRENTKRMEALGFPIMRNRAAAAFAPFDFIGDTLRGTRGIIMDMYQRPEKLHAAMENARKFQVENCIAASKRTGGKIVGMPLHKGSDGFMSFEQFETFYWPSLKGMLLDLIGAGLIPSVFYEGIWDQRLHYLAELPKGKSIGRFEKSDMFKVKEVLGDVMCITGGFPVTLLQSGTAEEVREHTRKMCEVCGEKGGFIMGAGTAIDYCDRDLVKVWVDATREFGKY